MPNIIQNCKTCIKYEYRDSIDYGILPTGKEVLELLHTLKGSNHGKHKNSSYECSVQLILQWIYCNVYPCSINAVIYRIDVMEKKV